MTRTDRYFRLFIILIISVVSLSGMSLVNSTSPDNNYREKLDISAFYDEFIESTLFSSFESSLIEVNINNQDLPLHLTLEKGFEINNRLFDVGLIYHVRINDHFSNRKALRKMLDILSQNYAHIRRESIHETKSGDLHSMEEMGFVYNDNEKFSYISRIITQNNDAWILVLTYHDEAENKVRDLLNSIWIENKKGLS